ncbi:MAG: acetate--CoA ligase family protein [Patescibacteria group bacterium]
MNLINLFNPKSVAVIGAAPDKKKLGYVIVANLQKNKKLKIYPVNPMFKKVGSLRCLASVKKISGHVDLAVIAVKPEIVPAVLRECGEKKIQHVIIITAGYKEIGAEGAKKEAELVAIAKKYNINLVGPNCLGIMDTSSELNAAFGNDLPLKGKVGFISQSGALGTALLDWATEQKIGFSKFVSLGNAAGATEVDFLKFFGEDKNTDVIVMYLEGLSDGKQFVETAKKISRVKPIIVIKAGRSERGAKAISSHTGSLAPSYEIFRTACRETGVIAVDSLEEMLNAVQLSLAHPKRLPSEWVILTNGGGPSIITADLIEGSSNLSLYNLSDETQNSLKKVLPPTASCHNPVDIIGDALSDRYDSALKVLIQDKKDFGIIVLLTPQRVTPVAGIAETILKFSDKKIIIPLFIGGKAITPAEKIFMSAGISNFRDPADLIKAISSLAVYQIKTQQPPSSAEPSQHATAVSTTRQMSFDEAGVLLGKYDLSVIGKFIEAKNKLPLYENKVSFPWAMKVVSPDVIHKTDFSAVKINITDLASAQKAWDEMSDAIKEKIPSARIDGYVLQPMKKGVEVVVGIKRDPSFGPVIVFGAGGIFTEILKDAVTHLCPVDEKTALEMINETKISQILKGARGQKSLDINALAKIISSLSRLAHKEKSISEIDLNPVIVDESGAYIVDARVMVDKK